LKSSLLFPAVFRIIGVVLALPGLVLGYLFAFHNYTVPFLGYGTPRPRHAIFNSTGINNLTDEFAITLIIVGLLFIGFSRLKNENKLTIKLRLNALCWAVFVNTLLASVGLIIQYLGKKLDIPIVSQHDFIYIPTTYGLFILLFIFLSRFYYLLIKAKNDKPVYLLPHTPFNIVGKVVTLLCVALAVVSIIPGFKVNVLSDEAVFFLPFLLLWICSKEGNEIGVVKNIRLQAMQIAIYINYSLFLIATWLIYGFDYWLVLWAGLISIQIIFLVVFYYQLYQLRKKHTKIATTNL
jgi:hypothetical protein